MIFTSQSPEETISFGEKIGSCLKPGDILALQGTLAAGKTTITKGIARGLGVSETVTSPTFTLISEYTGTVPLYHMDMYRLGSIQEFNDLGTEELLYGSGVCIIEWSERILSELPESTIQISIDIIGEEKRTITVKNWPYGDIPV